jgi:hypothetical protein
MSHEVVQSPVVTGEPVPETPSTSALGSLIGIFTEPKRTFASMVPKPRILTPIIALVLFQLVFAIVLAQSGIMKNDAIAKLEAKNAPQEQIDAVTRVMDSPVRFAFALAGPIVLVFSLLVSGALLYFMANLMLGARLRYAHYLCIAAYGGVVGTVDQIVRMGLALSRGTLDVHMGVGAFLGEDLSAPLRVLDTGTDPLLLWAVAIQALGVAVMAKKGFGFGLLSVLPGTLILIGLSAFQR